MSWEYETTIDEPSRIAILPDWSAGVIQGTRYRTEIQNTRRGMEQRTQHRLRPILTIEYQATKPDGRQALDAIAATTRGPFLGPWWPHGIRLQTDMTAPGAAVLNSNPIGIEWDRDGWVYLWSRATGGEFRQLTSRDSRNLTLGGTGQLFDAGDLCFPCRVATRVAEEALLEVRRHRTGAERIILTTI